MRPHPTAGVTLRAYGRALGIAVLLAFLVRGFAVEAFQIPSTSMLPTLYPGDCLLVNRLRYGIRFPLLDRWRLTYASPRPGDVVVFEHPFEHRDFVKRVIAIEGEVVEIRDRRVYVDGVHREVPSAYFAPDLGISERRKPRDDFGPVRIPPHGLFVMGDNREQSYDSRFWGFVDCDKVIGKVVLVWWSLDRNGGGVRWERIGRMID